MRGAWIEISAENLGVKAMLSRSPCGERGLKFIAPDVEFALKLVAPHAGSVD